MLTLENNLLQKKIFSFFNTGHKRSIVAKKNILSLFVVKGLSILVSFLLVSATVNFVNPKLYGIWLTLSSIVAWISLFDIGINNGLRNKLAASLAVGDVHTSQKYVSTTYAILCLIFIPLGFIFCGINYFINWPAILNVSKEMGPEISKVIIIVFSFFCIKFILSTINIILLADQKPAESAFRGLIEQSFSLLIIFLLTRLTKGSLLYLTMALCFSPLTVLFFYNFSLFKKRYRFIKPKLSLVQLSLAKELFGVGGKFFIIQIAGIIQFQTANFIIIKSFGATEVTVYNIAFKYFSILVLTMGILTTPLWSAVTEAYAKDDIKWIVESVKKFKKIVGLFFLGGIIMLIFSNQAYSFWLGKNAVTIPFYVSASMLAFSMASVYGGVFCGVLNGISALKIQFLSSIASPFIFISLSYLFINNLKWGISSIIIASIIANFNAFILAPLQFNKIFIKRKVNSIWIK